MNNETIEFHTGDVFQMYNITVNEDNECDPNEMFSVEISHESSTRGINVTVDQSTIVINDSSKEECGKCNI